MPAMLVTMKKIAAPLHGAVERTPIASGTASDSRSRDSRTKLAPALSGSPVPWDWDAFAAAREHYAAIGSTAAEPGPETR